MRLPNLFYAWPILWSSLVDGDEQLDLPKRQNNFVMCSSTLSCLKFSHYLNVPTADPVSHLLQLNASLHQTSKDQYKLLASYFKAIFWHIFVERNGTPRTLFKPYLIQTIFCWSNLTKQVRFYFAKNINKNALSILFLDSQKRPCCGYLGLKIKPTTHSS